MRSTLQQDCGYWIARVFIFLQNMAVPLVSSARVRHLPDPCGRRRQSRAANVGYCCRFAPPPPTPTAAAAMAEAPADASAKVAPPTYASRHRCRRPRPRRRRCRRPRPRRRCRRRRSESLVESNANDFGTIYLGAQKSISVECAD